MDERPSDTVVPGTTGVEPSGRVPDTSWNEGPGPISSEATSRSREQARRYSQMAREQALKRADKRKGGLASAIENFAITFEETGDSLERRGLGSQKRIALGAADGLRRFSRQLRENDTEALMSRAGEEFRARPGVVLAGCFALGFLGARLLKG